MAVYHESAVSNTIGGRGNQHFPVSMWADDEGIADEVMIQAQKLYLDNLLMKRDVQLKTRLQSCIASQLLTDGTHIVHPCMPAWHDCRMTLVG
jgi:hypothetical protein